MTEAGQKIERARILVDQNRWKEAEAECGRALATQGVDRSLALYYLAWSQQGQGRYDDAITTASRCIADDPETARGYHVRAVALRKKGDLKTAEIAAWTAVQKDAETTEYRSEWGWNLLVQGRAKEALAVVDAGLAKYPEAVNLHRARTEGLLLLGDLRGARDSAALVLTLDAEDSSSMAQLGVIAYKEKDLISAEKYFVAAMRIRPGYEYARQYLRKVVRERIWFYKILAPLKAGSPTRAARWTIGLVFIGIGMRLLPNGPVVFAFVFMALVMFAMVRLYALALATPLYALAIRRKPTARGLLTSDELNSSTWVGWMIVGAFIAWILGVFGLWPEEMGALGTILFLLPIPLSRAFDGSSKARTIAKVFTGLLALVGVLALAGFISGSKLAGNSWMVLFTLGGIFSVSFLGILRTLWRA